MKIIMNPAMIITWITGLWMSSFLISSSNIPPMWLSVKFGCVLILSGYHGFLSKCRKDFEQNRNQKSSKFFSIINEIPTILLIIIVILVIFKPA